MSSLEFAGDNGSLDNINSTQGQFRDQIAALNDMVKQIVGDAAVSAGSTAQADPLNAPFTLYVNPYTGSDDFVGGSYNDYEDTGTDAEVLASKLKRLEKQRLTCGFTPQRPFKTINRAIIEAAIITSKDWYSFTDPFAHADCVSIVLSAGVHTLYNDPGQSSVSITSWGTSKTPSTADLIKFNPATTGGVLLPRGCSLCGSDLRKTTIRPNWVPAAADEASDYSNRSGMLLVTGTGYFFGFTVMDKVGENRSHHLLDAFQFASESELDDFYSKTRNAVGTGADLSNTLAVTRGTEHEIVGPIDQTQSPTSAWDTTSSASPYIFNCSVRSNYGLGGAFMDGSKVGGLKSCVIANFTGVSLQKDMRNWETYSGGTWTAFTNNDAAAYTSYISADPDSVRMRPERLSRHVSAINDAVIQEVSVFAIGQGIHHFTDLGGEVTITNSNSNFGGVAALSKGYKSSAFPIDENWIVSGIKVPLDLQEKTGNVRKIYLGTISSANSSRIILEDDLATDASSGTVPKLLLDEGYTLKNGTYIWAENPLGDAWYAPLSSSAFDSTDPDRINISAAFSSNVNGNVTTDSEGVDLLVGKRVYIRRLVDTRTPSERRVSITATNTASVRLPQRNFIVQTDPNRAGGAISRAFTATGSEIFAVTSAGAGVETGVASSAEFTIRRVSGGNTYTAGNFYPAGSVIRHDNKHFIATRDVTATGTDPSTEVWLETFVHMDESYNAEDPVNQEDRLIVIDHDDDPNEFSTDLNIDFTGNDGIYGTSADAYQYRSSTDYKGVHAFLVALGLTSNQAHVALRPEAEVDRVKDPASSVDFPNAPSGGAATGRGNYAIEFRRPSMLRLYGHAWEWTGYLNYSKAIPGAQQDLSPQNSFTYFFTHELGGRVVPQGSDENGFNVTPKGLEDIATGTTLSVENVGSSSIEINKATSFDNLTVEGELRVGNLIVDGTFEASIPDVETGRTDTLGRVELADISELTSGVIAGSDNEINNFPKVVTARGLEKWKSHNKLISSREGTQYIYVDPKNGRTDSVNTLLTDSPTGNVTWNATDSEWQGAENLPTRYIHHAVDYINATFSPNEKVELRIGPGVYKEWGELRITCKCDVRAWDFTTRGYLNDKKYGGTTPFLDQDSTGKTWNTSYSNLLDDDKHPIFLSQPRMIYQYTEARGLFETSPLRFYFEQEASVTGIVWLGPHTVLSNTSLVSNTDDFWSHVTSGHSISSTRTSAAANKDDALNWFIKNDMAAKSSSNYNGAFARPCMTGDSDLVVNNVLIEAMCVAKQTNGGIRRDGVFRTNGDELDLAGIWLVGNVRINREGSASSDPPRIGNRANNNNYFFSGHHRTLVCSGHKEGDGKQANVSLGGGREVSGGTGTDPDYNFTWNNIHLVNGQSTMAYRDGWIFATSSNAVPSVPANRRDEDPEGNSGANWKSIGPGFKGVFDSVTEIGQHGELWHQAFTTSNFKLQGIAGIFGNIAEHSGTQTTDGSQSNTRTKGIAAVPAGFVMKDFRTSFMFRRAGTSSDGFDLYAANTPAAVGGTVEVDYNDLNLKSIVFRKGIDTSTAITVGKNFVI